MRIYLSGVVRDIHPMMNRHDPDVTGDMGWDADACEFRMCLDPGQGYPLEASTYRPKPNDQFVHMTLWYYTDRKEPEVVVPPA